VLLITFILVVVTVVSFIFVGNLTDSVSRDYARFYTMDSVNILGAYLNKEIALTKQASKTEEIINWFLDEEDPDKKAAAHKMMMIYAGLLQIDGIYFAVRESLNEYEVSSGAPLDSFIPFDRLDPATHYDRWFFEAIESEFDFTLSLDVEKVTNSRRLWINHKVEYNGEVIGIICSALEFDRVFNELFGEYDGLSVLGYVVDYNGIIQISSSEPEPDLLHPDTYIRDFEGDRFIWEISPDPAFTNALSKFLDNPTVFEERQEPYIVRLSEGAYQYLSVAPIPSTNWLKITFYSTGALFDSTRVLILVLIVLLTYIIHIIVHSLIIQKMLFRPLGLFTRSVSVEQSSDNIYGLDRDDEIGDLARETKDTWDRLGESSVTLRKSVQMHERQAKILQAVNIMATSLFSAKDDAVFETSLPAGMKLMAECMDLDRIYVWQSNISENPDSFVLTHEWLGDIDHPGTPVRVGQVFSYEDVPAWIEKFLREECVYGAVEHMPPKEKAILEESGVVSVLAVPVHLHGQFWGFVSFDNCRDGYAFSPEDVNILHSGSLIIASAINRNLLISNLKEIADQASSASRYKSEFLANMSHEIRTPMNSIIGFSELALDAEVSPKIKDYLNKILENSEWLLQIINDILDISKIESGKMDLENIPFDMAEMFAVCRTVIMPKALEKGLALHFYAEPSVGKRLYGDPVKLRQVLVNLLSNAVKFTNSGMIKVQAIIMSVGESDVTISFEIKDSGIGIAEEQISRIFDPFTQADTGTTRQYGGSGLGLPITKNIIEMMGGALEVSSTPGVESKFSFNLTFNAKDIEDKSEFRNVPVFDNIEKPIFDGEVLVCEDNIMNQQVICEHLERIGLHASVAANGEIGVEMVKNRVKDGHLTAGGKVFDLVLMDIHMPVMDGIEAATEIFNMELDIPIVAMTANVMSNDMDIYHSVGMKDCVGKPFTSQELWRCLMKYLEPVKLTTENSYIRTKADSKLRKRLISSFVRNNKNKYDEIKSAIESDDIKLAHRLTHTLKSNAAQLGETLLKLAAEDVEKHLKNGEELPSRKLMKTLEVELRDVLKVLEPMVHATSVNIASEDYLETPIARALLANLKPKLEEGDLDCLSSLDDIRHIKGSEELVRNIEEFEFEPALEALEELLKELDA